MAIHKRCFKRTALKHVYYLGWNRSPAQVGCMRQALGPGALGRPRGSRWRGRWEGGSGWGTHINPWLFHFNVWQNSLQIKKKLKKKENNLKKTKTKTHKFPSFPFSANLCPLEHFSHLFWINNAIGCLEKKQSDYHNNCGKEDSNERCSFYNSVTCLRKEKTEERADTGFPSGRVDKNPPANAGDMGSIPGPGRFHMLWSN